MKNANSVQEVLVSAAILGIIAVFTVPSVMQNYRQKILTEQKTVFLNDFREVLSTMHIKGKLAGQSTTAEFVEDLKNFMKIKKVCTSQNLSGCFKTVADSTGRQWTPEQLKKSRNLGKEYYDDNMGIVTESGVSMILTHDSEPACGPAKNQMNSNAVMNCIGMVFALDGSKENIIGKNSDLKNAELVEDMGCIDFAGVCWDRADAQELGGFFYAVANGLCTSQGKTFPTREQILAVRDNPAMKQQLNMRDYWYHIGGNAHIDMVTGRYNWCYLDDCASYIRCVTVK